MTKEWNPKDHDPTGVDVVAQDLVAVRETLGSANPVALLAERVPASVTRGWTAASGATGRPAALERGSATRALQQAAASQPARVKRRAWRLALPAAGVAAALLAGTFVLQSSTQAPPAGAAVMQQAVVATQNAGTARIAISVTSGAEKLTIDGVGDFGSNDVQLTVHAPAPVGDTEVIMSSGDLYVQVPTEAKAVLGGKDWVRIRRDQLDRLSRLGGVGGLTAAGTFDPSMTLTYLNSVAADVAVVGSETLQGEPTTHYRGHLSPALLAKQLPAQAQRDEVSAAAAHASAVPVDVWTDGQGRLRKLTLVVEESGSDTIVATIELSGYGTPLTLRLPPADQVGELPLLGLVGR